MAVCHVVLAEVLRLQPGGQVIGLIGGVTAGVLVAVVGCLLNGRVAKDRRTHREALEPGFDDEDEWERQQVREYFRLHPYRLAWHTLYFLPMEYWGLAW